MGKISKDMEDEICSGYIAGISSTDLSKKYGVSPATILNVIKKNGINTRSNLENNPPQFNEEEIIRLYTSGLSQREVAEQMGMCQSLVSRYLRKNNIPLNKRVAPNKKYTPEWIEDVIIPVYKREKNLRSVCDLLGYDYNSIKSAVDRYKIPLKSYLHLNRQDDFFEVIDTPEKAYILGFLITDGNINARRNNIEWKISSKDEEILVKIRDIIDPDVSIVHSRSKCGTKYFSTVSIQFSCEKMVSDLDKLGIKPKKSDNVKIPHIATDLVPHLIRGIIDGDGSIRSDGSIALCGNIYVVEGVVNLVKDQFPDVEYNIYEDKRRPSWYRNMYFRKKDSCGIYRWIYKGDTISLSRKKNKLREIHGNL